MKELKIVWGLKAKEQREQLQEANRPVTKDLVDQALRYMGSVRSPLYYETPEGWFTKTSWNRWGDGVEFTARVDFESGLLYIMEVRERTIHHHLPELKLGDAKVLSTAV